MILEYLSKPEPNIWNGVTVAVRAGYYVASLGAAGLALFLVGFGHPMDGVDEDWLRSRAMLAAVAAILLSLVAAGVRVQVLSAGDMSDLKVWEAMVRSRIGDAFFIRTAGLVLIILGALRWSVSPALAGMGALLVIASYAAMGHSMLYRPRQELAAMVTIHLACVAFWAGSLWPLMRIARSGGAKGAGVIRDWSRTALLVVPVLVASGLWGAALLLQKPELVLTSWYGNGFLAKMALVALVMALAAWHKLSLTPKLERGEPNADVALSRSIGVEAALMALVFYAAAEMVSIHPVDLGHRIAP
jgi:putative copper export protein